MSSVLSFGGMLGLVEDAAESITLRMSRRRGDLDAEGGQFAVDAPVAPQLWFSFARRRTRALTLRTVGGRPWRFGRVAAAWRGR